MSFKKINVVYKKFKNDYILRLASNEEIQQNEQACMPDWKLTKEQRENKPKKIKGFDDCVLYPPDYNINTVFIQGEKMAFTVNYKTLEGRIFIKGMGGYTGSYINNMIVFRYGIDYKFNPEIVQEILKQLPEKDKLHDTGMGVLVQY